MHPPPTYDDGLVPLRRFGVLIELDVLQNAVAHLSSNVSPVPAAAFCFLVDGGGRIDEHRRQFARGA